MYRTVEVELKQRYDQLADVAGFAPWYQRSFELDMFDAQPPDCDCVSWGIISQGVWEAQESTLAVDVLARSSGLVLDFGAHVGWYMTLASLFGEHQVRCYECDSDALTALCRNALRHGCDVQVVADKIDESFRFGDAEHVAFLKCDVEGAEGHVIDGCDELFRRRLVDVALIEMSPIFTSDGRSTCDYVSLAARLKQYGYDIFRVPPKGWVHNTLFKVDPLDTLREKCRLGDDWADVIASCGQDNFVFIPAE